VSISSKSCGKILVAKMKLNWLNCTIEPYFSFDTIKNRFLFSPKCNVLRFAASENIIALLL